ncbi:hypothetical protein J7L36_00755 [bacterium]|nr:hypothetical protein [bacterium]
MKKSLLLDLIVLVGTLKIIATILTYTTLLSLFTHLGPLNPWWAQEELIKIIASLL